MIHNRKSLVKHLNKENNWDIAYITFLVWEQKGYIKPDAYMYDGNRKVPVYINVEKIKKKLLSLKKQKKIRF